MDLSLLIFSGNIALVILLFIASIQDLMKKAVSDIIHYTLISYSLSFSLFLLIEFNYIPSNIFIGWLIIILFLIMYLNRHLAIGDIYIFFSIFYFISMFSLMNIFLFIINLSLSALFINSILSYIILKDKSILISFFLNAISLIIINLYFRYPLSISTFLFLFSLFLILISLLILKRKESKIKEKLTFKRSVNELVEGDWIENEIFVKKDLPKDIIDKISKEFKIEEKEDKYLIKIKEDNKISIILLILSFIPLFFFSYPKYILLSSIILISILTSFHDRIFKGYQGLSKKQIEILKELNRYQKLEFIISEGFPFVPAIFIGFLLSI